ncbi:MAG: hypothetical protein JKY56_05485 [Kofleriaceae bacterium]|nr:hypothetical protein [Kofleriaceae bacterium]
MMGTPLELWAQERTPAELIASATASLERGETRNARLAVQAVIFRHKDSASESERAEAFRILGLLAYYEGEIARSRAAFLQYLLLDPQAHLDPAQVPPEVILVFEDVRLRNTAEIDAHRKRPKKRYAVLNLLPGAGQFQNGERTKGFLLTGGIGALLATNLSTYFLLRSYCDRENRTCQSNGESIGSTARTLKSVNYISGIAAITLYVYSVVDGYKGYRRIQEKESAPAMSFAVMPSPTGGTLGVSLDF